jgi:hypothetical protein
VYIITLYSQEICLTNVYIRYTHYDMKRENHLLVRLSDKEKEGIEMSAKLSGITMSAWARQKLRSAAVKELREADMQIPFLDQITTRDEND